jgi:hypothetical protein
MDQNPMRSLLDPAFWLHFGSALLFLLGWLVGNRFVGADGRVFRGDTPVGGISVRSR